MTQPDGARDHAGVWFPPPLVFIAFFLAGVGLQRMLPLPLWSSKLARGLSVLLGLAWLLLTIASALSLHAAGTNMLPTRPTTALVRGGPYRYTRNPLYLGMLSMYLAAACWPGLLWPLLLAPALVWTMTVAVIRREEQYLTRKFGTEYRDYQARVRRWL